MLILAFSDGRDTSSWTRADQALALARSSDAVVDAVVTGELLPTSSGTHRFSAALLAALTPDERFLADLAAQTGGRVRNGEAEPASPARSATPHPGAPARGARRSTSRSRST